MTPYFPPTQPNSDHLRYLAHAPSAQSDSPGGASRVEAVFQAAVSPSLVQFSVFRKSVTSSLRSVQSLLRTRPCMRPVHRISPQGVWHEFTGAFVSRAEGR